MGYWMDPSAAPAWSPDGRRILFDTLRTPFRRALNPDWRIAVAS